MTTSPYIIPVYRALTIAGNVLEKDETGDMVHATVVSTTLPEEVEVVYDIR
ncbi:MAG: hypothetical protein H6595_07040 [Flavobacteriales bacterium]|nr:hypothetical protein [Flavobacteriales bacterium]MCB9167221.1 hypothetical protein [Flavobacteriales bacterium]MCB9168923.1 hypothetical protein [Flavobacteriales bacterium]MCB9193465.1 hypothetical protein [Flavobacteriales bacterium]